MAAPPIETTQARATKVLRHQDGAPQLKSPPALHTAAVTSCCITALKRVGGTLRPGISSPQNIHACSGLVSPCQSPSTTSGSATWCKMVQLRAPAAAAVASLTCCLGNSGSKLL